MSAALPHTVRGLLAFLLLTPLVISPGVFAQFAVSKALYSRVLIEIMVVAWLFLAFQRPEFRPPRSRVLLAVSLYVLAALLAALWGVNPTHSFWSSYDRMTGVVDLTHWLLFILVLASVVRTPREWAFFLNWQLAVTLVLSLIALTQAYGYSFIPSVVPKCRVDATLGNPSFLAPILVVSILIAAGLFLQSALQPGRGNRLTENESGAEALPTAAALPGSPAFWRVFWLAVIALGLYVLILTGTRGALIGLAAGAVTMPAAAFIWGNRRAVPGLAVAALGILTTVGILFAADHSFGFVSDGCADQTASTRLTSLARTGTADGSLATRLAAIEAGLRGFAQRPVLGWGPENFGYAFDRHVDPWVFRHGSFVQDKAHNQVIEELTSKGIVGALAFLGLWLALVRVIVGRRRPAHHDALAFAVLGGLAAYLVQNLFLFDTPSTLLAWLLLVGWAAAQERDAARRKEAPVSRTIWGVKALGRVRQLAGAVLSAPGGRRAAAIALVAVLGVSLYWANLQPYLAARAFDQASRSSRPLSEKLALAEQSFEIFPVMANQPRQLIILQFVRLWPFFTEEDRFLVRQFFAREAVIALQSDSQNAPMLITAILFLQTTAQSPEVLASLPPLLQQLQAIAPNRAETHQLLANQALKEGRFAEALRIAREYQAVAPGTEVFFAGIESDAQAGLGQADD